MTPRFLFHLRLVTVAHVLIVLALFAWSGFRGCDRTRNEIVLPVEFMVNTVAETEAPEPFLPPEPVPAVEEEKPPPVPEQKPEPPPERKRIKVSREKKVRTIRQQEPTRPRLTEEEIRKRLAMDATAGNRDILPADEDALGFEIVRRALYRLWNQPGREEVGDAVAGATLRFGAAGRVLSADLDRPSGNAVMDASVRRALLAVGRIDGLTEDFLIRHQTITVNFKVE
jgi:outer membrane biosynthesis protein TonB